MASGKTTGEYIMDAVDRQIAFDESGADELDPDLLPNLIGWLRKKGHTPEEIVDCISSLSGNR